MAQTKKTRRRTKHRGNAMGVVEARGRTGRKPSADERGTPQTNKEKAAARRAERASKPPTWQAAINRAVISAVLFIALVTLLFKQSIGTSLILGAVVMVIYIPLGYYTDSFAYRRRMARAARDKG